MILFEPGDIVKFRSIGRDEYDAIRAQVDAGTYRYQINEVHFKLDEFLADPDGYNNQLMGVLYGG